MTLLVALASLAALACSPAGLGGRDGSVTDEDAGGGATDGSAPDGRADGAVSLCGNGVLDDGEACDDGEETEGCDGDCTFVACGDGYVNRAAGERCEEGPCCAGCDLPASRAAPRAFAPGLPSAMVGTLELDAAASLARGFAVDMASLETVVSVTLRLDGDVVAAGNADRPTSLLDGVCDGCERGFAFELPAERPSSFTLTLDGRVEGASGSVRLASLDWPRQRAPCFVHGGMGAEIEGLAAASRARCERACADAAERESRSCRWGDEWLKPPVDHGHCYIKGGAGRELWPDRTLAGYQTRQGCIDLCAGFAADHPNRSCQWAGEWIIEPERRRCGVRVSGSDAVEPFTGTFEECIQTCEGFPGAACSWGALTFP